MRGCVDGRVNEHFNACVDRGMRQARGRGC